MSKKAMEAKANGNEAITTVEELLQMIRAGYSLFWVHTLEPRRAERMILSLLKEYKIKRTGEQFEPMTWDVTHEDWSDALTCVSTFFNNDTPRMKALIARSFNLFTDKNDEDYPEIVQHFINGVERAQSPEGRKLFFAITSDKQIPAELEREFIPWEFGLPTEEDLGRALDLICESSGIPKIGGKERHSFITSAKGMTYDEAKNAYSFSMVKHGEMVAKTISKLRAAMIEKQAALQVANYDEQLDDLIGLDGVVEFALKTAQSPLAKGMLAIGPTGTGKSHLMKGLSNALGKICVTFSFANIYQKFYGETEKVLRSIIQIILAIGDCMIFMDEFEKGFSTGSAGGGVRDLEERAQAEWLKFMQDRPDGIWIGATCNNIRKLDPEYLRSERWDTIFYVPMPSDKALEKMMAHYKSKYSVNGGNPDMTGWTGSDVKTCCRLAKMMGVSCKEAAAFVMPTSRVKREEIAALEAEAKERGYLRADKLPEKTISKAKPLTRALDLD